MGSSSAPVKEHSKRRVAYYYDEDIGNFHYGKGHLMKPYRIRLTHQLLLEYRIYHCMDVYRPHPAKFEEMTKFHDDDYLQFLQNVSVDKKQELKEQIEHYKINQDAPIFDGLFEFCQLTCGGSLASAIKLNKKKADITVNWMGGFKHARWNEACGYGYTNDVVIGILKLLGYHQRVLYVNIDIFHANGVEEAFANTDRVMTVSFHKYGDKFFPGTGNPKTIGFGEGKYYSVNVPLKSGITDASYARIFKPVMEKVIERFDPCAIVLQCGASSLSDQKYGGADFNLTLTGHGECVNFLRSYSLPLMMVGGGGTRASNAARLWTYETALAVGLDDLPNEIPIHDNYEYFEPSHRLHINPTTYPDENSREYLSKIQEIVVENLKSVTFVPSVQMQPLPDDDDDDSKADERLDSDMDQSIIDGVVQHEGEYYDHEKDGDGQRNEHSAKRAYNEFDLNGGSKK